MLKEKFFLILLSFCSMNINFFCVQNNAYAQRSSLSDDSYRLTIDLKDPRRYATRYDKESRTLQIRIIPARADEIKNAQYYDTRYVKRVIIKEKDSEVFLNIQLKNVPLGWVVATQQNPWRLVIDFWRTDAEKLDLDEDWNWQPNIIAGFAGDNKEDAMPSAPLPSDKSLLSKQVNNGKNILPTHTATVQNEHIGQGMSAPDNTNKELNASKVTVINSMDSSLRRNDKDLPEIYRRVELIKRISDARKAELAKQIGTVFGSSKEFSVALTLANELYEGGEEQQALTIYRKLAALNEPKFKSSDKTLWQAGESAFLNKSFDIANDYFRSLVLNHPGSIYVSYAKLRINDIDELVNSQNKGLGKIGSKNAETYSNMALSDDNPAIVKIAATLRVLDGVVDDNPEAVKLYQQILDACVTSGRTPFDLLKNCAYDRDRYLVEKENIATADAAVEQFKKLSQRDKRLGFLEKIVQGRVKNLLTEVSKEKNWNAWVEFEKKARPALLEFSFSDSDALFTRADAFEAVGENRKSVQLYEAYLKAAKDTKKKNEASSLAALLLYRLDDSKKAENFLRKIEAEQSRKTDGLTDRSVGALREISVAPYHDKLALNILIDELKLGRYEERNLSTLFEWSKELRKNPKSEFIYEKILAYPAKSPDEIQIVETSIMQYADDLRDADRFSKAGDMYFAVANLAQGSRRGEAAYKAGVVYARSGLFDKAKTAWLLAANDTNDKRYSVLANERLDRINK